MKKYLMVFLMVLLFSTAVSAQTQGYIGLFADVTHTSWCASAASVPGNFNMWIYCLPRSDGMFCAEFMIQMPADPTLILATATPQAGYSIIMGNLTTGVSICFNSCQTDWVWIYQVLMVDTAGNQNMVSIVPHPTAGGPNFANCVEPLRPIYDAVVFNNLYVNYVDGVDPECDETGTAPASWGAIKSLYAD